MSGNEFTPILAHISRIKEETYNVRTYYLDVPNYSKYIPGQFNMLYVPGIGEVPISISGTFDGLIAHTVRFVGSVTNTFRNLKVGDAIGVRGPLGNGWPVEDFKGFNVLIVGGGIGLAPLRPIIQHVANHRWEYKKLTILYGARTPADLLYKDEFSNYERIPNTEFLVTVDKGDETWKGHVGVVTKLIPLVEIDPENTVAFVCGPEIMMKFTVLDLMKSGIPPNRIFISLERRMKCGIGLCGHCQLGPFFICRHGPVFSYWKVKKYFEVSQL
jgi:NAD(P)H-flavin reductase